MLLGIGLHHRNVIDRRGMGPAEFGFRLSAAQQPRRVSQHGKDDDVIPWLVDTFEKGDAEFMEKSRREPAGRVIDEREVSQGKLPRIALRGRRRHRHRCRNR